MQNLFLHNNDALQAHALRLEQLYMPLLLSVVLLPLIGSALLFLQPTWEKRRIQQVSLFISLATFMLSLVLWLLFDNSCVQFQFSDLSFLAQKTNLGGFEHDISTMQMEKSHIRELTLENHGRHFNSGESHFDTNGGHFHANGGMQVQNEVLHEGFRVLGGGESAVNKERPFSYQTLGTYSNPSLGIIGLDGISLFFILLTTFLIPVCLLVSNVESQVKEYHIAFLILESLMLALFSVLDLFLFYIFFESVLIPIFVIIGVWGSRERKVRAAYQFFLYTLTGSLLMLLALLLIYLQAGSLDLQVLYTTPFTEERQLLLWCAFFASFAVKVPMVPVHIWLPEAHVEAPTAGSVLLAGIMLKLGTYGFLRFSIPLFPYACQYFTPLVYTLSVIAIMYTSLTTLRQVDLKKIIAYSSVAHMNFVTLGLFSLNAQGVQGSILLMISHGLVSPALFLLVGALYDRHKTRTLRYFSGLCTTMPVFGLLFVFFTMANISLPGTSSFVGEFCVLTGAFQNNTAASIFATTGIVTGAAYALWLCNRILFGLSKPALIASTSDLSRRETFLFVPFVLLVLFLGIYPFPLIEAMELSVGNVLQQAVYSA